MTAAAAPGLSAALLLPVGFALGPLHTTGRPASMVVRVGGQPRALDVDQAVVWDLAHGLADDDPLCGAELLLAHAAEVGIPDPAAVVAALVAGDLLVHVPTVPALTTTVSVSARRAGGEELDVEGTVRIVLPAATDPGPVVDALTAAAEGLGGQLRRLDGEHAAGVAATLPLGGFLP